MFQKWKARRDGEKIREKPQPTKSPIQPTVKPSPKMIIFFLKFLPEFFDQIYRNIIIYYFSIYFT